MASNINNTIPATGAALIAKPLRDNFVAAKSEIESLQGTVSTLQSTTAKVNTAVQFGSVANYTNIDASGTIRLVGNATYFDDLTGGIAAAVTSGAGVTLSSTEHTLDFVNNANTADYAWLVFQLEHRWKFGSPIFPHIHWEQDRTATPNWLIQYRWQRQGQLKTTWQNYKCNNNVFVWSTGTLNQISYGAGIAAPEGAAFSDIIQIRLIRDTTNTSTLFTGADPNTVTCRVTSFDIHIECDGLGSNTEYTKD